MSKNKFNRNPLPANAPTLITPVATEDQQELLPSIEIAQEVVDAAAIDLVQNAVEPEPEPEPEVFTVKNIGRCTHRVFVSRLPVGKAYTLTDSDKQDSLGMRKIQNAIDKGYLERV